MRIELVDPQVMSTGKDEYQEISNGVFQRDVDGAFLIVGADGNKAVIVCTDGGTD